MKITIAIPAYNEEQLIGETIRQVVTACAKLPNHQWHIVVADNNSKDTTAAVIKSVATEYDNVSYRFVGQPGKGAAVLGAWHNEESDVYCFMDADLATDLSALPVLVAAFEKGAAVVVGSRYHRDSRVTRTLARRVFSRGYYVLLRTLLGTKITDAPCGFKALGKRAYQAVVLHIKNKQWFFDSEMLIIAEALGYTILEIPVDWAERRPRGNASRVPVVTVIKNYIREVLRMRRTINTIRNDAKTGH